MKSREQHKFNTLMHLDRLKKDWPVYYMLRLLLLAGLGYAYLGILLIISISLLVAYAYSFTRTTNPTFVHFGPFILFGGFAISIISALRVDVPPPSGLTVFRTDAPLLFNLLDQLSRSLWVRRFDSIVLTEEFNASVTQVPRFALLGWHRNYLCVGLPLLQLIDESQLKVVLAHELGHIAWRHGVVSNWFYRIRITWMRVHDSLVESKHVGLLLIKPFLKWYIPYINACTLPLARANEIKADAIAAKVTGAKTCAETLASINVIGFYLENIFWPSLYANVNHSALPPRTVFLETIPNLRANITIEQQTALLREAMLRETAFSDSHPSLSMRLAALGESSVRVALHKDVKSASTLLGEAGPKLAKELDRQWQGRVRTRWHMRYEEMRKAAQRLAELEAHDVATLPLGSAIERAQLLKASGASSDSMLVLLRQLHEDHPQSPEVTLLLGRELQQAGDNDCVPLLESVAFGGDQLAEESYRLLLSYYENRGENEKSTVLSHRFDGLVAAKHSYQEERSNVRPKDTLLRHDLSSERIQALSKHLRRLGRVKSAWLVRKDVRHKPDSPCYVLGFTVDAMWKHQRVNEGRELARRISNGVDLPGHLIVLYVDGNLAWLRRLLNNVPDSLICDNSKSA